MIHLKINGYELDAIGEKYAADAGQLEAAYSRAINRTLAKLRTLAANGLKDELELRRATVIRRRIRPNNARRGRSRGSVWIGLNDVPVDEVKGRAAEGGGGVSVGQRFFPGAFIATLGGKRRVVRRLTDDRFPIEPILISIASEGEEIIDRDLFGVVAELFFQNFEAEVRARTLFGVGGG